jgi:hypothetical protein
MLLKVYGADDDTPEEWVTYKEQGEERIELKIRLLSDEKEQAIQTKCFGRLRSDESPSAEKVAQSARDKGAHALVDCKDFEIEVHGASATRLSQALGETVAPGEPVKLDGKLSPKVKDLLFRLMPDLLGFVVTEGRKLADAAAREEAKVSGN